MPIFSFIFGQMTDSFSESEPDKIEERMNTQLIYMIILASCILVVASLASITWNIVASKQSSRIKQVYFRKLLYQNTTWYDARKVDQVAANFVDEISSLTAIFSEKIHMMFMSLSTMFGGICVAFIKGWLMTLLMLAMTPLLFVAMFFFIRSIMQSEVISRESYGEAGAVTDECFTFIKTVKSLSGEEHEIQRYSRSIAKARDASIKFGWVSSSTWGLFFGCILLIYGLSYLIGSRLIRDLRYNHNWSRDYIVGDILTIFFCVNQGIMSLAQVGPILKSVGAAQVAVASILAIIKNEETEKCGSYKPEHIRGDFEFENVSFAYPSNPKVQVLKNLNIKIQGGLKTALVGASGCGKSTIVGLLQRYYDPTEGRILLDGVDLREYDIKYLRSKIGMVSQQPMLFADSIRFNMVLGTNIDQADESAIWEALELAEAKTFVELLPKQLDEFVGSMGGQLSGGQKQRIAIARAIIRKPDVFLFDEATSALDRTNELEIQKTLEMVAAYKTSITIAHRLSTIRNSDLIIVLKKGEIVEVGTHDQLVAINMGVYRNLVRCQLEGAQDADLPIESEDGLQGDTDLKAANGDLYRANSKSFSINNQSQTGSQILAMNLKGERQSSQKDIKKDRYKSIYSLLGPERWLIPVGVLAAACQGAIMPVFGFLIGSMLQLLVKLTCLHTPAHMAMKDPQRDVCFGADPDNIIQQIDLVVVGFACVAVGAFFLSFWQQSTFVNLGERFTYNLRLRYFRRLMYMDMAYFDRPENQPGALSARLATQCKKVNILVGSYLGSLCQSCFSFIIGIILAFVFSWQVALITLALSPLILMSAWMTARIRSGNRGASSGKQTVDGSEMLTESINNIKIVRSLTAEDQLLTKFAEYDAVYKTRLMRRSITSGVLFGLSQFFMFMVYATVFRVSVEFIQQGKLTPEGMFRSMFSLLFGVFGIGQSSQYLSELEEVRASVKIILRDMNEPSLIEVDPQDPLVNSNPGERLRTPIEGQIELRRVIFRYEGRKNPVLNGLSLKIPKGCNSAFVGASGCGKSTIMQLVLRFYDPIEGQILIDGVDIRSYALDHLRRSFGIVRQEPSLFNGTIDYNIRYNHQSLTDQDIFRAAELANALEFVDSTPERFQRNVGNRGEKLSGGQKQRVAIARIVAQKPQIYLFDEATSALDSQSEEVVQRAIEQISQGTTSLTIAHRISTIKNSDVIFVIENGKVVEQGGYDRLMALGGRFAELARG